MSLENYWCQLIVTKDTKVFQVSDTVEFPTTFPPKQLSRTLIESCMGLTRSHATYKMHRQLLVIHN